jgi:signal peptidase I
VAHNDIAGGAAGVAIAPPVRRPASSRGAHRTPPRHAKPKRGGFSRRAAKQPRPFWIESAILIGVALVIAIVVHTFFFQAFYIPSGSMENTLHINDRVLVNRLSYKVGHVQRGQIVVFDGVDSWTPEATITPPSNAFARVARDVTSFLGFSAGGDKDFIKRVIGVPGDKIYCCDTNGRLVVNGTSLNEGSYLFPGSNNANEPFPAGEPTNVITVPPGQLWVEGDHRDDSADSRAHTGDPGGGTIPEDKVVGRAFAIVWPPSRAGLLSIPSTFHSVSKSEAIGLPYGIGAVSVLPIGLLSQRRRRRARLFAASTDTTSVAS